MNAIESLSLDPPSPPQGREGAEIALSEDILSRYDALMI
jgi:hypothetical protein